MRRSIAFALLLLAAGCNRAPDTDSPARAGADQASTAPGVAVTAAPGVAFNYAYSFRLPGERIAEVQEAHAAACEKLGIARCRITGMAYRLTGERDVEARLDFKLDPAIARAFGKAGIDAVGKADGRLVESEIKGEDAGGAVAAAGLTEARSGDELKEIEAKLARSGLGGEERAQLEAQARQDRDSIRASRDAKAQGQESLARTPVSFAYASGDMAPGIRRALRDAAGNFIDGAEWILIAALTLLPWVLLGLIGFWFWRLIRRRPAPPLPAG
jgi:hypothetical protein